MKWLFWIIVLLLMSVFIVVLVVLDFCECVKSDIQQKIINNGVLEFGFMLNIVFNDQVDCLDVQVVGYCVNDIFKILYICIGSGVVVGVQESL